MPMAAPGLGGWGGGGAPWVTGVTLTVLLVSPVGVAPCLVPFEASKLICTKQSRFSTAYMKALSWVLNGSVVAVLIRCQHSGAFCD